MTDFNFLIQVGHTLKNEVVSACLPGSDLVLKVHPIFIQRAKTKCVQMIPILSHRVCERDEEGRLVLEVSLCICTTGRTDKLV